MVLGLKTRSFGTRLEGIDTYFFSYESKWDTDYFTDHDFENNERLFIIKHPQRNEFISLLGEQNTYVMHRLLLSYFESSIMFQVLVSKLKELNKKRFVTFQDIESKALEYNISDYNFLIYDRNSILTEVDIHTKRFEHYSEHEENQIQSLLFSMNLKTILQKHNIQFFKPINIENEEKTTGNINLLVNKMLQNREVGMVMHSWRKLNNINSTDFIPVISNIIEYIKKDVTDNGTNPDKFNDTSKLEHLLSITMDNKKEKKYFFKIFNDSSNFGFLSRHGKQFLAEMVDISTNKTMNFEKIVTEIANKRVPNIDELRHMYNVWHITVCLILFEWFTNRKTQ
ncbi:hypothetical protein KO561_09805 [Radiobacillus kanasensis]|uniref:hypothetical protein n=1 Tax=Radiobacillus kanasensis TaxID=2844358 RepID=UPI001E493888|nr:hypothetical protein [Radiobacillus kanasensis]UFU01205.1 hypothetical protein KO561_09805 [Radiobacillus kanasensis]